jgi:large subunit ribosomal protein L6
VKNMIEGVSKGFVKQLDITGVGYKVASVSGAKIVLNIGFSKPVEFVAPKGIKIESPTPLEIIITGIDKQLVGQVASEIRAIRKPEPYKAKGIRYRNEVIRRKAGKAVGGK